MIAAQKTIRAILEPNGQTTPEMPILSAFPGFCPLLELQTDGKQYKQRLAYLQGF